MKKGDEGRKTTVILSGYGSVITWCLIAPASLGSLQTLQLPHSPPLSFLGTDAISILELLYWPCCRKLPLSQTALRSGFYDHSPELLAFRTSGKRHRRGFCFILTSTSRISLGNISGTTILFTHIRSIHLNTETQMRTSLHIPSKKGGEKWLSQALFCICQMVGQPERTLGSSHDCEERRLELELPGTRALSFV